MCSSDLSFPAYYLLCHDEKLESSRVVNYSAYHPKRLLNDENIIAIESLHPIGSPPSLEKIRAEFQQIFPHSNIIKSFKFDKTMKVCSPSIHNEILIDKLENSIKKSFLGKKIYYTGMRTDQGVFFSHHTIGLAYDAALECNRELTRT